MSDRFDAVTKRVRSVGHTSSHVDCDFDLLVFLAPPFLYLPRVFIYLPLLLCFSLLFLYLCFLLLRLARALLSLAEAFGRDIGQGRILIRQKVSQSDLVAIAGIARENVSRVLNDWANRSLVKRLARYDCLENRAALQREAEE
jgi:hypothetical protein